MGAATQDANAVPFQQQRRVVEVAEMLADVVDHLIDPGLGGGEPLTDLGEVVLKHAPGVLFYELANGALGVLTDTHDARRDILEGDHHLFGALLQCLGGRRVLEILEGHGLPLYYRHDGGVTIVSGAHER